MKSINITRYCEFMSANSQNQIAPFDQVTIFFKHSVIFNTRHCKMITDVSLSVQNNMQDIYRTIM